MLQYLCGVQYSALDSGDTLFVFYRIPAYRLRRCRVALSVVFYSAVFHRSGGIPLVPQTTQHYISLVLKYALLNTLNLTTPQPYPKYVDIPHRCIFGNGEMQRYMICAAVQMNTLIRRCGVVLFCIGLRRFSFAVICIFRY